MTAPDDTDAAKMSRKLQDLQTATQTLVTGMWLYNEETDRLEPAAVTDEGRDLLGEPVGFARGAS